MMTKDQEAANILKDNPNTFMHHVRMSFRTLRWQTTFSYSFVTVAALLVAELILVSSLMAYFIQNIDLSPETLITNLRAEWTPMVQEFFSQEPPDIDGMRDYLNDMQGSVISTRPLFILGNLQLEMKAQDFLHFYYLLDDRTLVDVIPRKIVPDSDIGKKISYNYLPGLRKPLEAALDGVEDQNLLYEKVEPGNRITGAIPVFRYEPIEVGEIPSNPPDTMLDVERNLVGVIVFTTKRFPWEFLPLDEVLAAIGRSVLIFTLFAGVLGTIFGLLTAGGLTKRLAKISQAAHAWSDGDFSAVIRDNNDDELGVLTRDLNKMAKQLENLLDRRQELSVFEERNRLARDLHDSVKQQAFAASAQLGAARAHFEQNPEAAATHLKEAELLVGKVRQELTDLIQELRPIEMKGKGLIPAVEEYADTWSRRNEIEVAVHVRGERSLPLEIENSIFRIVQEALSNVAWHSHAETVDIVFNFRPEGLMLTVKDDGIGFHPNRVSRNGIGLESMRERAALINGTIKIESRPELGTKVILRYPYQSMEI